MSARRRTSILLALAGALTLCRAFPAKASSTSRIQVDARIELLGVVQYLSQERPAHIFDPVYRKAVEGRFEAFRRHPVVELYRQASRRPEGEGLGILLLYYSAPPALKLARRDLHPPYVETEADRAFAHRFIWELRDFAEVSGFAGFFREQGPLYREIERAATEELGTLDPAAAIENYLGVSLDCRNVYILSPSYLSGPRSSFILPYPAPEAVLDGLTEPFEVYTLIPWVADKSGRLGLTYPVFNVPSALLWHEALYVFIDPSFYYYESAHIPAPGKFYGEAAGCRENAINCLKSYTVAALVDRLSRRAWNTPLLPPANDEPRALYSRALSARLEEYENGKGTLWEFYPRLFSVFAEQASPSAPAPVLARPGLPVTSAADFFDRRWRRAFEKAR